MGRPLPFEFKPVDHDVLICPHCANWDIHITAWVHANTREIAILEGELAKIPNVETSPAPDVQILEFNLAGPKLCVRPYTANEHYWQVYFDTNLAIRQSLGEAGFSVPEQHYRVEHNAMHAGGSAPAS